MKKILFILLFVLSINSIAQQNIIYDVKENNLKLDTTKVDSKTKLIKNSDYQIALNNFNPFYYTPEVKISAKDEFKDFFTFLTKLTSITVDDIKKFDAKDRGLSSTNETNKNDVKLFVDDYNKSYIINQQLKLNTFNYEEINQLFAEIKSNDLLARYLNLIKDMDKTILEESIKKLELPKLEDVTSLDNQMKQLKEVLEIYSKNNKVYPVNSFATDLNTKIKLEIVLTPKEETKVKEIISKTYFLTIKTKTIVNFSSGIYMAWNPKKTYFIKKEPNGNYTIGVESERDFLPGVSVLGHLLYAKNQTLGLVVGAGIDIEATPNVLLGLCYKPTNSNIIISSGIGFSHQEKLSDSLNTTTEYAEAPSIKYKKILQSGFWFGISYSIL